MTQKNIKNTNKIIRVSIIPHTYNNTIISTWKICSYVNVEFNRNASFLSNSSSSSKDTTKNSNLVNISKITDEEWMLKSDSYY